MGCARAGALEEGNKLNGQRAGFSLVCWLRGIGSRPLKALVNLAYRSSRFWTAYLS
ncbi:MAG: hypothetical protein GWN99_07185 [Gemmatimonadetes bacterium]|uniref:Uncharacterized protein n=1 Tax=Candidatus Kutchimonas denitrificans TaxID=3056748 RepID=A0AAE5CAC3_9BACT|nr:hypothetical protein [Gemmatimonadota bacterium]NIR74447.1 hypothetical protein [Candidatus Kutchimonas denitrificans]NIS00843.1 hypothetical protein [Gemmatimonadota bacterium]NIT66466.1 hypothetical protein [Gemmatimonadota bacterium]NIU52097.1 hypothetical protein [Gemmatimonadota bacterium]